MQGGRDGRVGRQAGRQAGKQEYASQAASDCWAGRDGIVHPLPANQHTATHQGVPGTN